MRDRSFDLAIFGGGPAGIVTALRAAEHGNVALLVDRLPDEHDPPPLDAVPARLLALLVDFGVDPRELQVDRLHRHRWIAWGSETPRVVRAAPTAYVERPLLDRVLPSHAVGQSRIALFVSPLPNYTWSHTRSVTIPAGVDRHFGDAGRTHRDDSVGGHLRRVPGGRRGGPMNAAARGSAPQEHCLALKTHVFRQARRTISAVTSLFNTSKSAAALRRLLSQRFPARLRGGAEPRARFLTRPTPFGVRLHHTWVLRNDLAHISYLGQTALEGGHLARELRKLASLDGE
jgi:hypothetical protein